MYVKGIQIREYVVSKPTGQPSKFDAQIYGIATSLKVFEHWCFNDAGMERINADVGVFQPSVQTVCVHYLEFGSYTSLYGKEFFAIIKGTATSYHCSLLPVVKYSSLSQLT